MEVFRIRDGVAVRSVHQGAPGGPVSILVVPVLGHSWSSLPEGGGRVVVGATENNSRDVLLLPRELYKRANVGRDLVPSVRLEGLRIGLHTIDRVERRHLSGKALLENLRP